MLNFLIKGSAIAVFLLALVMLFTGHPMLCIALCVSLILFFYGIGGRL